MEYDFKNRPTTFQRRPRSLMYEMGHPVYRPKQPNGWPDTEPEWLSPEYLVRRLSLINNAKRFGLRPNDLDMPAFIDSVINRNFDAPVELYEFINGLDGHTSPSNQLVALFCSERMLKV